MTARLKFSANLGWPLFMALAASIGATEIWISSSKFFAQNPSALALGMTIDLVIIIPALYYFFVVRRKQAPLITLVPIIFLSVALATFILPAAQQNYLNLVKKTVPLLELAALGYIATKIRAIRKNFHATKHREIYFIDALAESCKRVLGQPPVLSFMLTEFTLAYFAFGGWFKKFINRDSNQLPFSYHRKNGYAAILSSIIMILLAETTALHLLLQIWSTVAAWIFTGLSIYSLLWLLGDYHAMRLHPIVLSREFLFIRTGLRWRVNLPLANIAAIEKFSAREKSTGDYLSLAVFGDPRLVIHCKRPVLAQGLFGIKREVRRLGVTVDEEKFFMETLHHRLAAENS